MRGAKAHAIRRLLVSTIFSGVLVVLVLGLTGCDDRLARMEQNQVRLEAMVAANARQIATVSSQIYVNNNEVQEDIQKLDRNDTDLAAGISTVQNEQSSLHEAVTSGNQTLGKRMTALDENQRRLQDGVAQVAGVTQRTASDVTAIAKEHATLHQMVQSSRKELGDSITAVAVNQEKTRTDIGQLQQADQRIVEQLVSLATSQDRIYGGVDGLNKLVQLVANDVTAVSRGQAAVHQTLNEHTAVFAEKSAILERNQQVMQASVDGIAGETRKNREGIARVAADQTAIQQTLGANHKIVAGQVADVIENQQGLQADVRGLREKTGQTVSQLTVLTTGQDAIRELLRNGNEAVTAKLTGLSEDQTGLKGELSGLHQKTDTVVTGVATVRTEQADLRENLKANHETTKDLMATLAGGQQQMQGQLDVLTSTAGQTALDVVALTDGNAALRQAVDAGTSGLSEKADRITAGLTSVADRQTATQQAVDSGNKGLADRAARIAGTQETLQGRLDALTVTTSRTAADVVALADKEAKREQATQASVAKLSEQANRIGADLDAVAAEQSTAHKTLKGQSEQIVGRVAASAENQRQLQSDIDTILATAGQTDLDVIALASQQDALRQTMQNHNEAVVGRIADLTNGQQETQSGLDTVVATTGQTALDMIALSDGQTKLAQAAQVDRKELAARLTGIVQSQQQWTQRLDAAQANVQTIAANIATLEQHITKLQGSLQPSLDGLTTQLGASGQGRAQFETNVNQDIQAVVEAISLFRQEQVSLADQMQQIQKRTQSQTKDIITAIQQLKQPPAEVKVSDSGTKLESSVAEAAAK